MRTQLNVRVAKSTAKQVRQDRKTGGGTNDIVVQVALEAWFTKYTPQERAKFYKAHDWKPFARAE